MAKSRRAFSRYRSELSILLLFIDREKIKRCFCYWSKPRNLRNFTSRVLFKKIQKKTKFSEIFQNLPFGRVRSSFFRRILISSGAFVSDDFRMISHKHTEIFAQRAFVRSSPQQDHRESSLKSLKPVKGTKSNNCYLASDATAGMINYRPLPCLEKCWLVPETWKENVPPSNKC